MMLLEGNTDLNGHGTHVAGTIAGRKYGAAKKAEVISVKVSRVQVQFIMYTSVRLQ